MPSQNDCKDPQIVEALNLALDLVIKYSTERTSESWRKVEATTAMGSSLQKIESRVEKGAVMIVHVLSGWLASSYPIRRAFLQHIS